MEQQRNSVSLVTAVNNAALLLTALYGGKRKRKCHQNFSEDSQFPSEIHSYNPSSPIQYLYFLPIFHAPWTVSLLHLPATVFSPLCACLQHLSPLLKSCLLTQAFFFITVAVAPKNNRKIGTKNTVQRLEKCNVFLCLFFSYFRDRQDSDHHVKWFKLSLLQYSFLTQLIICIWSSLQFLINCTVLKM